MEAAWLALAKEQDWSPVEKIATPRITLRQEKRQTKLSKEFRQNRGVTIVADVMFGSAVVQPEHKLG
jgi:hypothetical protein